MNDVYMLAMGLNSLTQESLQTAFGLHFLHILVSFVVFKTDKPQYFLYLKTCTTCYFRETESVI